MQEQDFGTDISTYPDLDPSFASMHGKRVLAEIGIRRLSTRRGTIVDDPDFGFDLRQFLNDGDPSFTAGPPSGRLSECKVGIEHELVKDQRILSCTAIVEYNKNATHTLPANCIHASITINPGSNPFTLELAVTSVTLTLLKTG